MKVFNIEVSNNIATIALNDGHNIRDIENSLVAIAKFSSNSLDNPSSAIVASERYNSEKGYAFKICKGRVIQYKIFVENGTGVYQVQAIDGDLDKFLKNLEVYEHLFLHPD